MHTLYMHEAYAYACASNMHVSFGYAYACAICMVHIHIGYAQSKHLRIKGTLHVPSEFSPMFDTFEFLFKVIR